MKPQMDNGHLLSPAETLRVSPYGQAAPTRSVPLPPAPFGRATLTEEQRLRRSRAAGIGLTTGGTPLLLTETLRVPSPGGSLRAWRSLRFALTGMPAARLTALAQLLR